jgi:hypothetical protein
MLRSVDFETSADFEDSGSSPTDTVPVGSPADTPADVPHHPAGNTAEPLPVVWSYSYAANAPSEDRYTVAGAPTGPAAGLFAGVWDGNGGVGVSEYLAERAAGCYWEKLAEAGKAGPEV